MARIGRIIGWLVVAGVVGAIVFVGLFAIAVATTTIPKPSEVAVAQATVVYWADGKTTLGRLGNVNRESVPLYDVPLQTRHAVLAAEDRSFYSHGGFSFTGIGRAVLNNLRGRPSQGGSTITQQYAKNAFLSQERTWKRKYKELLPVAARTEFRRHRRPTSVRTPKISRCLRAPCSQRSSTHRMVLPPKRTWPDCKHAGSTSSRAWSKRAG